MLIDGDQGQQRRDDQHGRRRGDQHEDVGEQLADRLLEALGQVVDVVGHPAEQISPRGAIDVAERKPVEFVLDVGSKLVGRALDDAGHDVGLEILQAGAACVEGDDEQQQRVEPVEIDGLGPRRAGAR